jgi:hypothetical protein
MIWTTTPVVPHSSPARVICRSPARAPDRDENTNALLGGEPPTEGDLLERRHNHETGRGAVGQGAALP